MILPQLNQQIRDWWCHWQNDIIGRFLDQIVIWSCITIRERFPYCEPCSLIRQHELIPIGVTHVPMVYVLHSHAPVYMLRTLKRDLLLSPLQPIFVSTQHQHYLRSRTNSPMRFRFFSFYKVSIDSAIDIGFFLPEFKLFEIKHRFLVTSVNRLTNWNKSRMRQHFIGNMKFGICIKHTVFLHWNYSNGIQWLHDDQEFFFHDLGKSLECFCVRTLKQSVDYIMEINEEVHSASSTLVILNVSQGIKVQTEYVFRFDHGSVKLKAISHNLIFCITLHRCTAKKIRRLLYLLGKGYFTGRVSVSMIRFFPFLNIANKRRKFDIESHLQFILHSIPSLYFLMGYSRFSTNSLRTGV